MRFTSVGQLIRARRDQLGIKQYQMAQRLGVEQWQLSRWETQWSQPGKLPAPGVFEDICAILELSPEDLFAAAGYAIGEQRGEPLREDPPLEEQIAAWRRTARAAARSPEQLRAFLSLIDLVEAEAKAKELP